MPRKIKVFFDGKVFRPIEPVDLSDLPVNVEFRVTVELVEPSSSEEELPEKEPPLLKYLELAQHLGVSDLAEQHDHYLIRHAKAMNHTLRFIDER
jgi:hypothetical protein